MDYIHFHDAVVQELPLVFPRVNLLLQDLLSDSEASLLCSTMAE